MERQVVVPSCQLQLLEVQERSEDELERTCLLQQLEEQWEEQERINLHQLREVVAAGQLVRHLEQQEAQLARLEHELAFPPPQVEAARNPASPWVQTRLQTASKEQESSWGWGWWVEADMKEWHSNSSSQASSARQRQRAQRS